ncbi:hypothetical protein HPP92_011513 [Vanilla planifolia]|uniref:Adenosylmethionine decarboxylase n=1 Tax=Vanilla planifolia TaxID=51239 RepID=A0A835V132_VANPL|nr:hypothetical protein HPP92_011513 [Vanilla planifolia]
MAGFEGFEKRLELHFSCSEGPLGLGLRLLSTESLDRILSTVHCSIVSAVSNARFDAYVLSESSLFVYPEKVIIKTCGTTALSAPCLSSSASLPLWLFVLSAANTPAAASSSPPPSPPLTLPFKRKSSSSIEPSLLTCSATAKQASSPHLPRTVRGMSTPPPPPLLYPVKARLQSRCA